MAGATCPKCGKKTLFNDNKGKSCSKCDFFVEIQVAKGKGRRCVICGKYLVGENGTCRECGAKHYYGED